MKKKIFSNWGFKLVSLLIAFGLWLMVMYVENPIVDRRLNNIQVTLINTEALADTGKVYEILDETDVVRTVTVKAPKNLADQINAADIVATADFNQITHMDTVEIVFSLPQYASSEIKEIVGSSELLRLNVEDRKERSMNIRIETVGEVAEGYELDSTVPDQNRIQISGPESKIAEVETARVEVDVTDITSTSRTRETIRLYDAEGNVVDYDSISMNFEDVAVTATVLATKTVPIDYTVIGQAAEGYLATGEVELSVEQFKLAGSASILNGISRITIPEEVLDISEYTENFSEVLDITDYLPNGVKLAKGDFDGTVRVTVFIEPIEVRRLSILPENIQIINVPEGFEAEIPDTADSFELEVRGLENQVSQIQESQLQGTIDIEAWLEENQRELVDGASYYIGAEFRIPEDVTISKGVEVRITFTGLEE